jgi:hypothetical protein
MVRELVTKNFWLKLFSVVLATLIWLAVNKAEVSELPGGRMAEMTREFDLVSVAVLSSVGGHEPAQIEPSHVKVKVGAQAKVIEALRFEQLRAFVQLQPGQRPSGAFAVEVLAPREVIVLSITPNAVILRPVESL